MANVQIKRYSGSAWVDINPKTTIGQVSNLSSQLANMQIDIDEKANLTGATFTGNIKTTSITNTYNAQNVYRFFTSATPVQTVIYTKIKYLSGIHMPVIRLYGYAYGLNSPVELKIGFYIYNGNLGWAGAVSMGAWRPDVYLFKYTDGGVEYVALGLIGSVYFLGFQIDLQSANIGTIGNSLLIDGWYSDYRIQSQVDVGNTIIPSVGISNCILVPYKSTINNILFQFNGVSQFTYDGTVNRALNITPAGIGAATATHSHPKSQITNFDAEVLALSPAGARTPTAHKHASIEVKVGQDAGSSKLSVFQDIDGSGYTTKTGLELFRQYGSSQSMLEISKPYGSTSSIDFITNEADAFKFNKPIKVGDTNVSLAGHKHTWSEITSKPSFATVATSGSYNDLTNKPMIPAAQVAVNWNSTSGITAILNKPNLATVATSGSYNDLSNKPTIPSAQVQSNWNATTGMGVILNKPNLATVATSGSYNDLSNKPTIPSIPSVMDTTEGNTGTATTQRTINAKNLKEIILNHSPAGARTPTTHGHTISEITSLQSTLDSKIGNSGVQQITGGHGSTVLKLFYDEIPSRRSTLGLWASEPGVTYHGAGIGYNVTTMPYGTSQSSGVIDTDYEASWIRFDRSEVTAGQRLTDGTLRINTLLSPNGHLLEAGSRVYSPNNKPSWSDIQSKPSVIIEEDYRLTNARPASDVSAWAKKSSLALSDVPTISIAKGGTGATTALAARANLGLGNGATATNVIRQVSFQNNILTIEVV